MGHVTSYPAYLRQLDLSHNEISCWPSLATIHSADPYIACYNSERLLTNFSVIQFDFKFNNFFLVFLLFVFD